MFKLLKKDATIKWTNECQEAFDKIKEYLSYPPVLIPPEPGRPLLLYLTVLENSFGCVLGQHDVSGKREHAIYYRIKKFKNYEIKRGSKLVEVVSENYNAWKIFFDGAVNAKGVGIKATLISPASQHFPTIANLRFFFTNNTTEYKACIMGMNMAIDLDVQELLILGDSNLIIRQDQGEWETRDIKLIP
ncbi:uncharacterized protein [Nicotiana tomentosiformis]|uniref:uncharacterized protein n=1 Tax=Nicotiana tomentosiformis TaxID=4098 RepID=UPI00388CCD97